MILWMIHQTYFPGWFSIRRKVKCTRLNNYFLSSNQMIGIASLMMHNLKGTHVYMINPWWKYISISYGHIRSTGNCALNLQHTKIMCTVSICVYMTYAKSDGWRPYYLGRVNLDFRSNFDRRQHSSIIDVAASARVSASSFLPHAYPCTHLCVWHEYFARNLDCTSILSL